MMFNGESGCNITIIPVFCVSVLLAALYPLSAPVPFLFFLFSSYALYISMCDSYSFLVRDITTPPSSSARFPSAPVSGIYNQALLVLWLCNDSIPFFILLQKSFDDLEM